MYSSAEAGRRSMRKRKAYRGNNPSCMTSGSCCLTYVEHRRKEQEESTHSTLKWRIFLRCFQPPTEMPDGRDLSISSSPAACLKQDCRWCFASLVVAFFSQTLESVQDGDPKTCLNNLFQHWMPCLVDKAFLLQPPNLCFSFVTPLATICQY